MRKLNKPTLTSARVYIDCVNTVSNTTNRFRLVACAPLIQQAEQEFVKKITTGQMHTIGRETIVNGAVTATDLQKIYTYRMVQLPQGRIHYDTLILSAPNGLCPLCAHRDVSTLDHYLPKTKYPRLTVTPVNLIPACGDCNKGKLVNYPTTPEEETLHPYFDDIENDHWLIMTVLQTSPVSVNYSLKRPNGWQSLLFARLQTHFTSFKLKSLYSTQAGRELSGIKQQLINIHSSGAGERGVKQWLTESASSRELVNINSWQTALYKGLADDDWFCRDGFLQIGI